MTLSAFDHVNIHTGNLDEMVAWYGDILGLTPGFRPDFSFPGAWLYLGDQALIHLVGTDPAPSAFDPDEKLRLEHIAFRATGFSAFKAKLNARGIEPRYIEINEINTVQVNIYDPDGNHLHIDFDTTEDA